MKKIYYALIVAGLLMIQNTSATEPEAATATATATAEPDYEMYMIQNDLRVLEMLEKQLPELHKKTYEVSLKIPNIKVAKGVRIQDSQAMEEVQKLKAEAKKQLEEVIALREETDNLLMGVYERQKKLFEGKTCPDVPEVKDLIKRSSKMAFEQNDNAQVIQDVMGKEDFSSKAAEEWKQKSQDRKSVFDKLVEKAKKCDLFMKA